MVTGGLGRLTGVFVAAYCQYFVWAAYQTYKVMDHVETELSRGNFSEAERLAEVALDRLPKHTRALYLAGKVYVQQNRDRDAIEVLQVVIDDLNRFAPTERGSAALIDSNRLMGQALARLGDIEGSQRARSRADDLERQFFGPRFPLDAAPAPVPAPAAAESES